MDIAEFQIIRSPQRFPAPEPDRSAWLVGEMHAQIAQGTAVTRKLFQVLSDELASRTTDPLSSSMLRNPDSHRQFFWWVVGKLSQALDDVQDRMVAKEWQASFQDLIDQARSQSSGFEWKSEIDGAQAELFDHIVAAMGTDDLDRAASLTRLYAVLKLTGQPEKSFATPEKTAAFLATKVPHLPHEVSAMLPARGVELVREASVSDLYVVRQEWRGYVLGDIAQILNVMPGADHERSLKRTDETETINTSEVSEARTDERETRTEESSELQKETERALRAEISGSMRADLQQSWGTGSIKVSGGVEGRLSLEQTERQASKTARSATTRALAKVESITRETRSRRALIRSEELARDAVKNGTNQAVRGVYRWLDRVDRYQLWRYPDRLQLEFQLPEPAEFLRWMARQEAAKTAGEGPPAWDLSLAQIVETADLIELAKKYRATSLPRPPAAEVSVNETVKGQADNLPTNHDLAVKVPVAIAEADLLVPAGYEATTVSYKGIAMPAWGSWNVEAKDLKGEIFRISYHGSVVSVSVGDVTNWASNQRNVKAKTDAVMRSLALEEDSWVRFGDAVTEIEHLDGTKREAYSVQLTPPGVGRVKAAVQAAGVSSFAISFKMTCKRSAQTYAKWQQEVYDALFEAWSQWRREWENAQTRRAELEAVFGGSGSAERLQQIMREEVKRQVIAWLLEEPDFAGRPGLADLPASGTTTDKSAPWRNPDPLQVLQDASVIQFMEQAFEWGNIQILPYPYYWASKEDWAKLQGISHPNPDFERFLKAGSARVVLSARPAFKSAVLHWLIYRRPFFGRPLPLPGDSIFVSIAEEIRSQTQPPDDGIPGDSWEAKVGTSLLWLETPALPPRNTAGTLGAAPNTPRPQLLADPT